MNAWSKLTPQQQETRRRMCQSLGLALPIDRDALDRAVRRSIVLGIARIGQSETALKYDIESLRPVIVARYHRERIAGDDRG